MSQLNRIVVVGSSGSGKTTVARGMADLLDLPHLEMDSVFHRDGLANEPHDEFLPIVDRFSEQERWVIDGNYTSAGVADVVWPKADTFVWLDPPRRVATTRVIRRTLRRTILREELWPGVHEPFSNLYSLDPFQNIIVWTWTRHARVREEYERAMADGTWSHAAVHRLGSQREVAEFLEFVASTRRRSGYSDPLH
jgi:adenylate kinase family enzyme